jgi:hypothetical protein
MTTFREWISEKVAPGFWRRKWGKLFMGTLGHTFDLIYAGTKYAVKARFPSMCPDDALGYVGEGRNMDTYRAESVASYRAAVIDAWRQWETAGTVGDENTGLINKLYRLGYSPANGFTVSIVPWYQAKDLTPGPADHPQAAAYANWWSAFWIVISPNPFTKRHWGDAGLTWGKEVPSVMGNPDGKVTWGSSANSYDVLELRRAIHKWKAAHEICPHVIFRDNESVPVFDLANVFIGTRAAPKA